MGKKYRFLFLVALILGVAVSWDFQLFQTPRDVSNIALFADGSRAKAKSLTDEDGTLREIYDVGFEMPKAPMGNVNTYLPKYKPVDLDGALYYFALFGMEATKESVSETEDYFSYADGSGTLRVYKFSNLIHYYANTKNKKNAEEIMNTGDVSSDEEALALAAQFVENKFLFLSYEETEVNFDHETYDILFINRIGNIRNYAFVTRVVVDKGGNVLEMEYNYMNFERIGSSRIKSMEKAFLELPVDFAEELEGSKILLDRCNLVYVYENSIVQPAYLFEGRYPGGKNFQCFINAALFE